MELRKRFDIKHLFIGLYLLAFLVYIIYGLQPVDAAKYDVMTELAIPSIGLTANVTELSEKDGKLETPETIVGSYMQEKNKTLLIGHASGVFRDLKLMRVGDKMTYNGKTYKTVKMKVRAKESIDMSEILEGTEEDSLIIMTCAGRMLDGGDATHRLLVYADRI